MSDSSSPMPANTEEAARDLQDRVARFARTVFVVALVIALASLVVGLATQGHVHAGHAAQHELVHAGALVLALVTWLACRRRTAMTLRTLQTIDAGFTIAICAL